MASGKLVAGLGAAILILAATFVMVSLNYQHPSPHPHLQALESHAKNRECISNSTTALLTIRDKDGKEHKVVISREVGEEAVKDAIAAAVGVDRNSFALHQDEVYVAVAATTLLSLSDQPFSLVTLPTNTNAMSQFSHDESPRSAGVSTGQAKGPRTSYKVVLCTVATGAYHDMGVVALKTAAKYFAKDASVQLFLLSDNTTQLAPGIQTIYTEYRGWPQAGLQKFNDMLAALEQYILESDFFYFMDADIRFHENTPLVDVAGDLVGVMHPFYPQSDKGFCTKETPGWCNYPVERKEASTAYIPMEFGKFGPEYKTGNFQYIQSAFWGGKRDVALDVLRTLKKNIDIDVSKGFISTILQDERYLNWYFWKSMTNKNINIRILKSSYLYPDPPADQGFGPWLLNTSRPIIVHVRKRSGKPVPNEMEIANIRKNPRQNVCLDRFLEENVGLFGCHHNGGVQGWIWKGKSIQSVDPFNILCLHDASGPEQPVRMRKCDNSMAQEWSYDKDTGLVENLKSGLCFDTMRWKTKDRNQPLALYNCDSTSEYQNWEFKKTLVTYDTAL